MKHLVVLGGAGFIPSHLCDRLLKDGYAVTAIDHFGTGSRENLSEALKSPNFELIEADITQGIPEERVKFVKSGLGIQGVFHMASPASPVDFERIPFEILKVGSFGTFHAVDLALKHGARLIFSSTSEVYGDPLVHPQTEKYWGNVNSLGPRACYDESKRFGEAVISNAMRGSGKWNGKTYTPLNAAIVRIFNTYGPRMRPDDGRVIPEFCENAIDGKPLHLHGGGQQTRSFCFVSDEVDGFVKLFQSELNEVVNIGNPIEYTVADLAKEIIDLAGSKSGIARMPERPDDPKRRCPDITKAKTLLGWEPKVGLREGLSRTLEYFKSKRKR